ncbi:MAG: signal recognition particle-docking protein FtsY [Nanoarchaeota archaeon]|nr:signal recognition particle-docking protein FtsY [Nanoarchaeota archaeon]
MFKFLKDKVKKAISGISEKFEEEGEVVEEVVEKKPKEVKKKDTPKPKPKKEEKKVEDIEDVPKPEEDEIEDVPKPELEEEEEEEKKGFFSKIKEKVTTKKISDRQFDEMFWDLEVELLENNVAFEVIEKIKQDLKDNLVDKPLQRGQVEEIIIKSLEDSINEVLDFEKFDIVKNIKTKKPYVIVFIGVNGSGKTTSIAKFAHMLKEKGFTSVLVAADTFRAASIQQLEEHGKNLDVKVIKHDYGSDPAAVAFDGVKFGKQKGLDVVLIDTAGRQHSNINLRDEMKKIIRVVEPDLKVYVGEMIAGNDCIEQIQEFDKAIDIDGVILSKADIDEKGGTAISVSYVTKKPILYLGIGQDYGDLKEFNKEDILKTLGFRE